MYMLTGTLAIALLILFFLHLIFWKIRSILWINNIFATIVACLITIIAAVGLFMIGGVHMGYTGIELLVLGLPSFCAVRNLPSLK